MTEITVCCKGKLFSTADVLSPIWFCMPFSLCTSIFIVETCFLENLTWCVQVISPLMILIISSYNIINCFSELYKHATVMSCIWQQCKHVCGLGFFLMKMQRGRWISSAQLHNSQQHCLTDIHWGMSLKKLPWEIQSWVPWRFLSTFAFQQLDSLFYRQIKANKLIQTCLC